MHACRHCAGLCACLSACLLLVSQQRLSTVLVHCCCCSCRVVARRCMGKAACIVLATDMQFGGDPCPTVDVEKKLYFQYR